MSFSAPTSRAQRRRRILPWLLYLYALVLFAMHFVRILITPSGEMRGSASALPK